MAIFHTIGARILMLVAAVTTIGLSVFVYIYSSHQEKVILQNNEATLNKVSDSVIQGMESVMLAGYADIAQTFAGRLKAVPDVVDFRILRTDGHEAFLDNTTITAVNEHLGDEMFALREEESDEAILSPTDPKFAQVLREKARVTYYHGGEGRDRFYTVLAPLIAVEACLECHEGELGHLRGVLKLTTSLAEVQEQVVETWTKSLALLALTVVGILMVAGGFVRRSVVGPIRLMTQAMNKASAGDLTQTVPVSGDDELGHMASSFNHMVAEVLLTHKGLQSERDKLSTILRSAREGIVVTDGQGHVVLVNPAAEEMLGKDAATISEGGVRGLFDDRTFMDAVMSMGKEGAYCDPFEYNERVLTCHAAEIRRDDGTLMGAGALIRDITEETRLREELTRLSVTDGLTGLFNRRHMEKRILDELKRSVRYGQPVSLLMFDVDHFKKFNDTHGHDQGDRVLQSLAVTLRDVLRKIDVPCRYGGEEFIAVLPNTPLEGAMIVAERMREEVELREVDGLHVTISVGVAVAPPYDQENVDGFIECADKGLYSAKRNGRNQVCYLTPEELKTAPKA